MRNLSRKSEKNFGSNQKFLGPISRPPRSQNGLTPLVKAFRYYFLDLFV